MRGIWTPFVAPVSLEVIHLPDYATSEAHPSFEGFECTCGASDCRAVLSHDDWKKPFIQHKYAGHFLRHIAVKIAGYQTSVSVAWALRGPLPAGFPLICCLAAFPESVRFGGSQQQ